MDDKEIEYINNWLNEHVGQGKYEVNLYEPFKIDKNHVVILGSCTGLILYLDYNLVDFIRLFEDDGFYSILEGIDYKSAYYLNSEKRCIDCAITYLNSHTEPYEWGWKGPFK